MQREGAIFKCIHLPMPDGLTSEKATELRNALRQLPRPTMVQCTTGKRASAVLLLSLADKHGLNADSAFQLGRDMDLKCTRGTTPTSDVPDEGEIVSPMMRSNPLVPWMRGELGDRTLCQAPPPAVGASPDLIFRQLFDEEGGSSTYTYLLADGISKEAILIDPVLEQVSRDLTLIGDLGLTLKYALNTHCHADHITGTGELKKHVVGLKSVISKASGAHADVKLEYGDTVKFGQFELKFVPAAGHTNGCVIYVLGKMAFTGDAVLIRGCGRTDFQEGSAKRLYESVHSNVLGSLDEDTAIYPAHDYKGRNVSTVGIEKHFNARLTKIQNEFIEIMDNLGLSYPKKIDVAVPANMTDGVER